MSDIHDNAKAFVLCAAADDTSGNQVQNQELALFIISLILAHEKGQLKAALRSECEAEVAKTTQVAALSDRDSSVLTP
ncbi:hypothetical protein H4F04_11075 [Vibrio scophthalmi]|uniref:hypothetical protein n=1 Tax=Vibrio scophthalmi TaxID=45658 RepID=UPI002FF1F340